MARVRVTSHPGEILLAEYLEPMGLSARELATMIGVPSNRISDIVRGRRGLSADSALRLGRFFKTTPQFWLNLQSAHDLSTAMAEHDYSKIPTNFLTHDAPSRPPSKRATGRKPSDQGLSRRSPTDATHAGRRAG